MEKSAAPGVLPRQAHRVTVAQQRAVGDGLGETPVNRISTGRHFAPVFENLSDARVWLEAFGNLVNLLCDLANALRRHCGIDRVRPGDIAIGAPIDRVLVVSALQDVSRDNLAMIERIAIRADHAIGLLLRDDAFLSEPGSVELARRWMCLDLFVHHWLSHRGLVGLVVAVPAIADEIDDDVLLESHAKIERETGYEHDRFRVIAVDMKDRRLHHFCHLGAVQCGTCVQWVAGRKADLIVEHDMHRAACSEAAGLGHIKGFHDHALTGEGRITVYQYR